MSPEEFIKSLDLSVTDASTLSDDAYIFSSDDAETITIANKAQLDNICARHTFLPKWVFKKLGRERRFSAKGMIYLAIYVQFAVALRIRDPETCYICTDSAFSEMLAKALSDQSFDFYVVRSVESEIDEKHGLRVPKSFGFMNAGRVSKLVCPDLSSTNRNVFDAGEGLFLIPVWPIVKLVVDRYEELTAATGRNAD